MDDLSINTIFPEELLETLLQKLPPADLKSALLVCHTWKRLGEQPDLWLWVNLKVTQRNLATMPQILAMNRLRTMTEICLDAFSEDILRAIGSHPELKVLKVTCSLSSADPALLATVIHKMEEVDLGEIRGDGKLSPHQSQAVFNLFGNGSKLKRLDLYSTHLSNVDPQVLARAVSMLEEVQISGTDLTEQQCQAIFQKLGSEARLKVLYIGDNDLSSVQPEAMARAVSKLEDVSMTDSEVTAQQVQAIFHFISRESKLKKLCINGSNYFSSVHPEDLGKAIAKLEEAFIGSPLTSEQCEAIFKFVSYGSQLKTLWIDDNDLTSVDPTIMAGVLIRLEEINLSKAKLTDEQYKTFFKLLANTNSTQLKKMVMWKNDLTSVDAEDLGKAFSKLEDVGSGIIFNYYGCFKLTAEQCQAIFKFASLDSSKLKKFNVSGYCLDPAGCDLSSTDPKELAKVICKSEEARLSNCKMTPEQCQTVFKMVADESNVKLLDMKRNDLTSVDPEILAKAVNKKKGVILMDVFTKLTPEQRSLLGWVQK